MSSQLSISLIGLGQMGTSLSSAFLSHGYKITVWNRSPSNASLLVARDTVIASSVASCISANNIIIICVLNNAAVRQILSQVNPLSVLKGKLIINLTNGTPEQARSLSAYVMSLGSEYLHGGIMAVPAMIGTPGSLILYSGPKTAFQKASMHLSHLGMSNLVSDTDAGSAPLYDIALLVGMYGMFAGFLQSTALMRTGGVSAKQFLSLLTPWLMNMIGSLGHMADQIDEERYRSAGSNLAMQAAAIENMVETCKAQGVRGDVLGPFFSLMQRRVDGGGGSDGLASLIEEMTTKNTS